MSKTIQTPFLRYLLNYYGNLAVQLRPVRLNQPLSLLNITWNILLSATCIFTAFTQLRKLNYKEKGLEDIEKVVFTETGNKLQKTSHKPLFILLSKLAILYGFPSAYILCLLYFFAISLFKPSNSLDLITLLDTFRVKLFDNKFRAKRLCLLIILASHLNFLTVIPTYWWADALTANWLNPFEVFRLLHSYLTFYILKFCIVLIISVELYFCFALYYSLRESIITFKQNNNFEKLEIQFQSFARTSVKIRKILSVPLILITFIHTFDVIINVASWLLDNSRLDFFYQMVIFGKVVIIVYYGEAINWKLKELDKFFKVYKEKNTKISLFLKTLHQNFYKNFETEKVHQMLKSREMVAVYKECFQLKLFNFYTSDVSFTLSSIFFILNYAVLITQTNA